MRGPADIAKERQRLGLPPVEPTVGGGSVDTSGGGGKRKGRKEGEAPRKLTPEEQYQARKGGGEGQPPLPSAAASLAQGGAHALAPEGGSLGREAGRAGGHSTDDSTVASPIPARLRCGGRPQRPEQAPAC